MDFCCCGSRRSCVLAAFVASLVIGIVTAFLRITAVITLTPVFLWVVFGIAVGYLAVLTLAAFLTRNADGCVGTGSPLTAVLAGILGTVLLSVVLLAITFVATSVVGAILTGGLLFFFSLTVTATACLIRCLADN